MGKTLIALTVSNEYSNTLFKMIHITFDYGNIPCSFKFPLHITSTDNTTVWPEILAGTLFWWIGSCESNPSIFRPPKLYCNVIIIA